VDPSGTTNPVTVGGGLLGGFIAGLGVATTNGVMNGFSPGQFSSDVAFCTVAGGLMGSGVGWNVGLGMLVETASIGLSAVSAANSAAP